MGSELLIERRDAVAVLTLSNPAKRNALDPELCQALTAALRDLPASDARALVLTGAGDRAFSAGFDIDAMPRLEAMGITSERVFDDLIEAVAGSALPIVAALGGVAFGGGCELAATCDLRIAHAGVKLSMPPARLGIVYPPRGLARFAALCGESRARALFLTARTIEAAEAHAWGLLDEVVPPDCVLPRALELAGEMAALAPLAVQGMRRTFEALVRARATLLAADESSLAAARAAAWRSADAREARAAFAERRKPAFRGE